MQGSEEIKINRRLTCQEIDREDCSLRRLSQEHGLQKLQNVQPSVFIEGLASVGTRQQVLALGDKKCSVCDSDEVPRSPAKVCLRCIKLRSSL